MLIDLMAGKRQDEMISVNPEEIASVIPTIGQSRHGRDLDWHEESFVTVTMKQGDKHLIYPNMRHDDDPNHSTEAYIRLRTHRTFVICTDLTTTINLMCKLMEEN